MLSLSVVALAGSQSWREGWGGGPDSYGSYSYSPSYSYTYSYGSYGGEGMSCDLGGGVAGTRCKDGSCVKGGKGCDGTPDCPDGSDEINCSFECMIQDSQLEGYTCADGSCVSGRQRCDAKADCTDGSDERGCAFECVLPKGGRGVLCSGDSGICIHRSRACDGIAQCPGGTRPTTHPSIRLVSPT